jgi:hypothetical protein
MVNESKIEGQLRVFVVPVDILETNLSIYEKMVYIVLRSHCNAYESTAFPSIPRIARLAGMGQTKTKEVIKSLVEKGLITYTQQFKVSSNKKVYQSSHLYTVNNVPEHLLNEEYRNKIAQQSARTQSSKPKKVSNSQRDERYAAFYELFPDS